MSTMTDTSTERLLTTGQAAKLLNSSRQHVVDLCESGDLPYVTVGTHGTLKIRLDEQGTSIRMEVAVVHHMASYYGLACREIDLDSVTHLRRLVALNLGDETLAEREFAQLTHS